MSIKNETYKGITLFLVELRKHLAKGIAGNFWRETSGKTAWPVHYKFKDIEHKTLMDFVNWFIANHKDVSDGEFNQLLMELPSIHWILERKGFFMLEVLLVPNKANEDISKETVAKSVQSDVVADEKAADSVSEDKVSEEVKEPVPQKKAAPAKKPVGRKASK